jgi:urease accessory protein
MKVRYPEEGTPALKKSLAAIALLLAGSAPALAHLDPAEHGSFAAGFSHPVFGADHILAMVAVGLWAALLGQAWRDRGSRDALWLVPAAFVAAMIAGFAAAMLDLPLPFVEPVILASVVVVGLLAAVALNMPVPAAMALVGFFAFFHGHAHGGEIGEAGAWPYAAGFAVATAILHAAGVAAGLGLGRLLGSGPGRLATRLAGVATAAGGLWLAIGG